MLEIKPISTTYPVVKPAKIKKDDHPPDQQQSQKRPAPQEQGPDLNNQHIDEIV